MTNGTHSQVKPSNSSLESNWYASQRCCVEPRANTYNTDDSLPMLTHGSKESVRDFPRFLSKTLLRATSSWSRVADTQVKVEYAIKGCCGSGIMDASTDVVGEMDGGSCERTEEPVLS